MVLMFYLEGIKSEGETQLKFKLNNNYVTSV